MWILDPETVFLNHGSFGACPLPILNKQQAYREQFEKQPVAFVVRELDPLISLAKESLAAFIIANREDLALVPNVTHGVNAVLKSLPFSPGDEVVITNHIYGACRVALNYQAKKIGLVIREVNVPFPGYSDEEFLHLILAAISPKTKLVFVDHITSPTGIRFPVETLVFELNTRNIDCFIDGAHAPGAIPLDLNTLNAAYYTGNCHKWMCAPKGVGFLHVRKDKQDLVHPLAHSHFSGPDRSFEDRFHWSGTADPTAALCLPEVIDLMGKLLTGGWPALMESNHQKIVEARHLICDAFNIPLPCPDDSITTLAAIPFGLSQGTFQAGYNEINELQERLYNQFHIEVPVFTWPDTNRRIIRPAAQLYNSLDQYLFLIESLQKLKASIN